MGESVVWVPVCDVGCGTGTARVRDARTGRAVRVPADGLAIQAGGLYLPAASAGVEDGLHRVVFPGGASCWVRLPAAAARAAA